jgi:hypothetical protein
VQGCSRRADILVCQLRRLSSRPQAGLESPANRQAGKPAPRCEKSPLESFRKRGRAEVPQFMTEMWSQARQETCAGGSSRVLSLLKIPSLEGWRAAPGWGLFVTSKPRQWPDGFDSSSVAARSIFMFYGAPLEHGWLLCRLLTGD